MPNGKSDNGLPTGGGHRSGTNSGAKTLVLIVDDHEMVRVGLHEILAAADDIEVVSEGASAGAATREAGRCYEHLSMRLDRQVPAMLIEARVIA